MQNDEFLENGFNGSDCILFGKYRRENLYETQFPLTSTVRCES